MENEGIETRVALDDNGILISIDSLDVNIHKGLQCGLKSVMDGSPVQAVNLNSNKTPFFRRNVDSYSTPRRVTINESPLHYFVKSKFRYIKELIGIEGITTLTGHYEENRLSVKSQGKEIKHYKPDAYFNECAVEVVLSKELSSEKRMFFEGIKKPIVTVRYGDEERSGNVMFLKYHRMEKEGKTDEVIADILSRCSLQTPYEELVTRVYIDMYKDGEEDLEILQSKFDDLESKYKKLESKDNKDGIIYISGYVVNRVKQNVSWDSWIVTVETMKSNVCITVSDFNTLMLFNDNEYVDTKCKIKAWKNNTGSSINLIKILD